MIDTTILYVKPGFGRWHVQEQGFEKSIAYFPSEQEAIDYAIAFGRTKPEAVIRVLDERGDTVSEKVVEMSAPG